MLLLPSMHQQFVRIIRNDGDNTPKFYMVERFQQPQDAQDPGGSWNSSVLQLGSFRMDANPY